MPKVPLHELREGARVHMRSKHSTNAKMEPICQSTHTFLPSAACAPQQLTFLVVTVDITARRAAEDALRAAQAELARVARLTTVGAMAASIAHEINQPLASIVTNGNAGLRWLARREPNLEEARSAFGCVVKEGHRAAQIITGIRAMFQKGVKRKIARGNKRTCLRGRC